MSTRPRTAGAPAKVAARTARKTTGKTVGRTVGKTTGKTTGPTPSTPTAARRRAKPGKAFELILLGATGYTGRQALRAVLHQRPEARIAVAGRNPAKLRALLDQMLPPGAREPGIVVADTRDADALRSLARQGQVLFNLAGPYHATGDAVVAACIEGGTHYLDLSAETFWMQRLVREQHDAAVQAGVKIMPCAGYEALPFDLATLWAAHQLRAQAGEACASVKIGVTVTGRLSADPRDLVSGGTAASVLELLAHDHSDCLRDMACLLPPGAPAHDEVKKRNALQWLPRWDDDLHSVLAPTLPGPFINPPVILRGIALAQDRSLFSEDFIYQEGTPMARLLPGGGRWLPPQASRALQWAMAASVAVPLANLSATIAGPLRFQRQALRALLQRLVPRPGRGPGERALDAIGYELEVVARGERGARFGGRVIAQGHPGYRSTPEMAVCAALGLADGSLGRTPHVGIVSPAAGLGIEAVAALRAAGVQFNAGS